MNYSVGQFAKKIGKSVNTLQRWDREGILKSKRTPTNQRFYTDEDLELCLYGSVTEKIRKKVGYCRVSSSSQKSDLENQVKYISEYTNALGIILDEVYQEIGSGLNYNRKQWNRLLEEVKNGLIDKIYITYKDRFIRFGYEWFEEYCKSYNTEIIVLNQKQTSPEEELTEDLLSILHDFSARSHGIRSYKTKLEKEIKGKKNALFKSQN